MMGNASIDYARERTHEPGDSAVGTRLRTPVFIYSPDPVSAAGAKALLMWEPGVELVCPADVDRARVALVLVDAVDQSVVRLTKAIQREGRPHVIVVAARFEEEAVVAAVAAGATNFVRRTDASKPVLAAAVREADLCGCTLPEGLRRRAEQYRTGSTRAPEMIDLTDMGLDEDGVDPEEVVADSALSARECQILRLFADGYDTGDVAEQLAYSESTIKGVLAKVMARLEARNRCHAVALAVRQGMI